MGISVRRWAGLGVLWAIVGGLPAARGQQPKREEDLALELMDLLNTPVTGASKREQRLLDSPQAIEVLTGDEIRQMGIYRLQDALKLMTSIDLLEADNGFSVIGMRGVMQEGQPRTVQVLVDGVPMYSPLGGSIDVSNLPLPLELVERIEVVRGPSSTLYGANAVVGVVAITTRKEPAKGSGGIRISAADKGTWRGGLGAGVSKGNLSVLAGYQGYSMGASGFETHYLGRPDLRRVYRDAQPSADPQDNPWVGTDAGHGHQAMASVSYTQEGRAIWGRFGQSTKWYGPETYFAYRTAERTFGLAGWREAWSKSLSTELRIHRLNLSNRLSASQYLAVALEDPGFLSEYKWVDQTITQVELQANWDPNEAVHFVFGADTRKLDAGKAPFIGIRTGADESASGGFASVDWMPRPGWTVSAGVRMENESLGGSRTSPRLALVWNPGSQSALRVGYFTSTRSPQVLEQRVDLTLFTGQFYPSAGNPTPPNMPVYAKLIPNQGLRPEKTTNVEVGYRHVVGGVTFDATLYQMKLTSLVNQTPLTPYVEVIPTQPPLVPYTYPSRLNVPNQFQNVGDATNTGLEIAATWVIRKGYSAGINGAWLRFRKDNPMPGDPLGDEFAYAVPSKVNAWFRIKEGKFSGFAALQHVGATTAEALQARGNPYFESRPSFLQFHAQGGYEFEGGFGLAAYVRNGAEEFTLQGATGPERQTAYQAARREMGITVSYRF